MVEQENTVVNQAAEVIIDDVIEVAVNDIEEVQVDKIELPSNLKTHKGNAYDLTSLIALISGVGILFFCLTCNLGYYLMPFIAIILGIIGVVMAKKSVNPERTQLLSWLGIGGGVAFILVSLIGIALYIILLIIVIRTTGPVGPSQFSM